jgi:hypothetical protein
LAQLSTMSATAIAACFGMRGTELMKFSDRKFVQKFKGSMFKVDRSDSDLTLNP